MKQSVAASLFFVPLLIQSSGCGPIYDTVYDFTPPSSRAGEDCIEDCKMTQFSCEETERDRSRYCEDRERDRMDRCNERIQAEKNRPAKWDECGKIESCTEDMKRCESRYRLCYQACGGTVTARQECVAFCDSAKK